MPLTSGRPATEASPERREDWAPGTPIWLLDVDGVLNAITLDPDRSVWPDYRRGQASARERTWRITWSPTVCAHVREVHETRSAEVLWLTTWEGDANEDLVDLLDLPRLPLAGLSTDAATSPRTWWKLVVARALHSGEPDRPILWTDDDLAVDDEARGWIRDRGVGIAPTPALGLVAADLDRIRRFLTEPPGRP